MFKVIKKRFLVTCLCLFIVLETSAQTSELDLIRSEILSADEDTTKVILYCQLAFKLRQINSDSTLLLASKALELAKKLGYTSGIARSYLNLGVGHHIKGQYDSALKHYDKSLLITQTERDLIGQSKVINNMGLIYWNTGQYPLALDAFQKALKIDKKLSDKHGQATSLGNIGLVYRSMLQYENALKHLKSAFNILIAIESDFGIAQCSNNIGLTLVDLKKYDESLYFFKVSLKYSEKSKVDCHKTYPLLGIAQAWLEMDKFDSAQFYIERIFSFPDECLEPKLEATALNTQGIINYKQNNDRVALRNLTRSLEMSKQIGLKTVEMSSTEYLAKISKKIGDLDQALKFLEQYIKVKDEIYNEENSKEIAILETQFAFDLERQQLESQLQLEDSRFRNVIILSIAILMLLISLFGLIIYRRRKKHQLLKIRTNQLQELDAMKSQFFANFSHELRTPLSLILGPLNDVIQRYSKINESVRKKLKIAIENGTYILKLVNEILDLSRLKESKLEVKKIPVQLYQYLYSTLNMYHSAAESKKVTFRSDVLIDENLLVTIDRMKTDKIIHNLIGNALKYTRSGDEIYVRAERIKNNFLRIIVKDTGCGISKAHLPYIFERYFQSGASPEGGVGIGLSLAKAFADLLDGRLSVQSEIGVGTVFILQLPAEEYKNVNEKIHFENIYENSDVRMKFEMHEVQTTEQPISRQQILVVEDHAGMRNYILDVLEPGYQVITANDGKEALNILHNSEINIDLIISDVMMPEMDGFELLETIRSEENLAIIPVIILSALANSELQHKSLIFGVDDYLVKPFCAEELQARVSHLLSRKRTISGFSISNLDSTNTNEKSQSEGVENSVSTKSDLEFIKKIEMVLRREVKNNNFGLGELAREIGCESHKIHQSIKNVTGLTPEDYSKKIRLTIARELLLSGQFSSMDNLIDEVGIEALEDFCESFTVEYGCEPEEYLPNFQNQMY